MYGFCLVKVGKKTFWAERTEHIRFVLMMQEQNEKQWVDAIREQEVKGHW